MGKMGRLSAKTGMAKVTSDYEEVDLLNEYITDGDAIPDGLKYVQPLSGRGSSRGVVAGRGRGRSGGRRGRPVASQPRLDQCPVHSVPDYLSHQQPNQKRKSDESVNTEGRNSKKPNFPLSVLSLLPVMEIAFMS